MALVSDVRRVLREPHFGSLYATRLVTQGSDGTVQVALASFVLFNPQQAASVAKVAAAFATLLLPYSIVGPFAGVFIDRWRRQRILVVSNIVRAVMILVLALLVALGNSGPLFYVVALAALSVSRFYLAALSAALPHVVRREMLVVGNSVSTTSGTVISIAGGGLGYAITHFLGSGDTGSAVVLLAACAGYLSSSLVARQMGPDLLGPDASAERARPTEALADVARGLVSGARHIWQRRPAAYALAAMTAHRFLYGLSTIMALLLYRNYFNGPDNPSAGLGGLGLVFVASALGYLVAAIITPQMADKLGKERWIWLLFAAAAVFELTFGLPFQQGGFLLAAFMLGVVSQGAKICVDTIVQQEVADAYRGRVFAFYDMAFNVSFVSAAVVSALALPENGKSALTLILISVGYAVTAAGYALATRRYNRAGHAMVVAPLEPIERT